PLHRDAHPVLSTARSSTHRTGEFAVLGSARDASIDAPRPSSLGSTGGMSPDAYNRATTRSRAGAPPVTRA
ncbi:hypothetical protein FB107DRAFT_225083, partial [Schizophyllum commune]